MNKLLNISIRTSIIALGFLSLLSACGDKRSTGYDETLRKPILAGSYAQSKMQAAFVNQTMALLESIAEFAAEDIKLQMGLTEAPAGMACSFVVYEPILGSESDSLLKSVGLKAFSSESVESSLNNIKRAVDGKLKVYKLSESLASARTVNVNVQTKCRSKDGVFALQSDRINLVGLLKRVNAVELSNVDVALKSDAEIAKAIKDAKEDIKTFEVKDNVELELMDITMAPELLVLRADTLATESVQTMKARTTKPITPEVKTSLVESDEDQAPVAKPIVKSVAADIEINFSVNKVFTNLMNFSDYTLNIADLEMVKRIAKDKVYREQATKAQKAKFQKIQTRIY